MVAREAVRGAAKGIALEAPGGPVRIHGENQHISKTVRIGRARSDGMFDEVWNSGLPVEPDPFLRTYSWASNIRTGA